MDINEVKRGRATDVMKKSGHAHREDYYFSLVSEKGVENLEANSVEDRDDWVFYFFHFFLHCCLSLNFSSYFSLMFSFFFFFFLRSCCLRFFLTGKRLPCP